MQLINRRIVDIENGDDKAITGQIQNLEANREKQLKILEQRLSLQKQAIEARHDAECHEIRNELAVQQSTRLFIISPIVIFVCLDCII